MSILIPVERTTHPRPKPPATELGFGRYFTDHMFLARYSTAKGWFDSKITPYRDLPIDPAASVLHYGQAMFEGMKAYRQVNGRSVLFRPAYNWERMHRGAERLCMVAPPQELFLEGVRTLVRLENDWIPSQKGGSLYIRPTLIGTEPFLGVRPSDEFLFFIIASPVAAYYSAGANEPVKIWVERKYTRAAPGGLGDTKAAANYAGSLKAAFEAKKRGYSQVLWLDVEKEHIEEVGTMNVFFVFKNEIVTPQLDGTILRGGVRDSLLTLLRAAGKNVSERKVSWNELQKRAEAGELLEAFGAGTAAAISPIGELANDDQKIVIHDHTIGPVATQLYDELLAIHYGEKADEFGWIEGL